MNCVIVDDNKIARSLLRQLASQIKDLEIAGECGNAMEAYNLLQEQPVDLLLLDIEMPGMSGLELSRNLGAQRPLIVFITSKRDYAADAFDLNVADFLVKPVMPGRFLQAIDKVRQMLQSNREEVRYAADAFLFIRDGNVVRRLKLDDLLYAEAMGDYVKLYTPQRFYAIHASLKAVEERLPPEKFFRVHRSFIVALSKIDTLQSGVLMIQDKAIPVADAYRGSLNKRMNVI